MSGDVPRYGLLIGGEQRPALSGRVFPVENPKNGELLAEVAEGDAADIDAAVASAGSALRGWSSLGGAARGDILHRAADLLRRRLPELVTIEVDQIGRPRREMEAQLGRLPEWYSYFGAVARVHEGTSPPFGPAHLNYTRRVPLGVVGQVTPWNHPLLILTKKVAPALAAGNTIVVKPSELAPITPILLGEVLREAGLPDGAYNVVPGFGGTAGLALVSHPGVAKIDLTGGTETGKRVAEIAARNLTRVAAELGGKASVLVFRTHPSRRPSRPRCSRDSSPRDRPACRAPGWSSIAPSTIRWWPSSSGEPTSSGSATRRIPQRKWVRSSRPGSATLPSATCVSGWRKGRPSPPAASVQTARRSPAAIFTSRPCSPR
jgi:hypothetical protein